MTEIKDPADGNDVQNPPARLIAHEMFQHVSPPEKMAEAINRGNSQQVDDPPARLEETDRSREKLFLHEFVPPENRYQENRACHSSTAPGRNDGLQLSLIFVGQLIIGGCSR